MKEFTINKFKNLFKEKEINVLDYFVLDSDFNQDSDLNIISVIYMKSHPSSIKSILNLIEENEEYSYNILQLNKDINMIRIYF